VLKDVGFDGDTAKDGPITGVAVRTWVVTLRGPLLDTLGFDRGVRPKVRELKERLAEVDAAAADGSETETVNGEAVFVVPAVSQVGGAGKV